MKIHNKKNTVEDFFYIESFYRRCDTSSIYVNLLQCKSQEIVRGWNPQTRYVANKVR